MPSDQKSSERVGAFPPGTKVRVIGRHPKDGHEFVGRVGLVAAGHQIATATWVFFASGDDFSLVSIPNTWLESARQKIRIVMTDGQGRTPVDPGHPSCATCRHYLPEVMERGFCRRHAPKPACREDPDSEVIWPLIHDVDWCGEHEPMQRPMPTYDEARPASSLPPPPGPTPPLCGGCGRPMWQQSGRPQHPVCGCRGGREGKPPRLPHKPAKELGA